jgi:hypothetical protein
VVELSLRSPQTASRLAAVASALPRLETLEAALRPDNLQCTISAMDAAFIMRQLGDRFTPEGELKSVAGVGGTIVGQLLALLRPSCPLRDLYLGRPDLGRRADYLHVSPQTECLLGLLPRLRVWST